MSRPRGPRTTYVDDSVFSYHGGSHWALQIARDCREYEQDRALRDSLRATKLARLCGYLGIIAVTIAMVVGGLATY